MTSFKDIDGRLCTYCGACVSVCPAKVLSIDQYSEKIGLSPGCIECGACYRNCPGMSFSFPDFDRKIFGNVGGSDDQKIKRSEALGSYRRILAARASDEKSRSKSSSGGAVTALLTHALKKKVIDGAIIVGMSKERPWIPEARIARTEKDVLAAAGSKYCRVPVCSVLRLLEKEQGNKRFAIVALPCQVHGIRKLIDSGDRNAKKISLILGLFCGFSMKFRATEDLIRKLGAGKNGRAGKDDVESIEYRGGPWPGGFRVMLKDGTERFLPKKHYDYLNLLYLPERCAVCPDLTAEFSDVSFGDCWLPELGKGWSTVIARSGKGEKLVSGLERSGKIESRAMSEKDFLRSHGHLVSYKKKLRPAREKLSGLRMDHGIEAKPSVSDNVKGIASYAVLRISRTGIARRVFMLTPIPVLNVLASVSDFIKRRK